MIEDDFDKTMRGIRVMWVISLVVSLALTCVIIWALVSLVQWAVTK